MHGSGSDDVFAIWPATLQFKQLEPTTDFSHAHAPTDQILFFPKQNHPKHPLAETIHKFNPVFGPVPLPYHVGAWTVPGSQG